MIVDRLLGPALPELGWVPAPRYLMRRARILKMFQSIEPGRLLEIGPGAGTLLTELVAKGFCCEALESSVKARELVNSVGALTGASITMHAAPADDWTNRFDVLCAFDVLEHIEDDRSALRQWFSWLKPNGRLLLSIPAHMRLWSAGDVWAGHFRRYERRELVDLLAECNLRVETFECYGFPLTNLSEHFAAPSYARRMRVNAGRTAADQKQNNDRSGIDRGPHVKLFPLLRSPIGKLGLCMGLVLQQLFISSDLGSGYLILARPQ